jgi:hypothetical protein
MSWTEKFSLVILTAIFSLVGGAAAEHFWPSAVPTLGAASIPNNLTAHRFTLVDTDGTSRALIDADGKTRAEVSLSRGISRVRLFDAKGAPRMGMAVNDEGASNIALVDDDGRQRASMDTASNGDPTIRLSDKAQPRIGLSVTDTSTSGIALLGGGLTHAALSIDAQNRAALSIYGTDGKLAASIP